MAHERFDGMLLGMAQQMDGGIDELLNTFFSFLGRKTDFFTGNMDEKAEKMVMEVMAKHQQMAIGNQKAKAAERKENAVPAKKKKKTPKKEEDEPKIVEIPDADEVAATTAAAPATPAVPDLSAVDEGDDADQGEGQGKLKPNAGNGANLENYSWIQTLTDVEITIPLPVPPGGKFKSKDLVVDIKKKYLKVGVKGQPPIIDSELSKAVQPDECTWSLEDGKILNLSFLKVNKMEWWTNIIPGDPEVNTKKVAPENSKLGDLDGETRGMVEKMMFDQRQKQAGKPTSDEQSKLDVLEKFKKQHPEMDFSNVKMQ